MSLLSRLCCSGDIDLLNAYLIGAGEISPWYLKKKIRGNSYEGFRILCGRSPEKSGLPKPFALAVFLERVLLSCGPDFVLEILECSADAGLRSGPLVYALDQAASRERERILNVLESVFNHRSRSNCVSDPYNIFLLSACYGNPNRLQRLIQTAEQTPDIFDFPSRHFPELNLEFLVHMTRNSFLSDNIEALEFLFEKIYRGAGISGLRAAILNMCRSQVLSHAQSPEAVHMLFNQAWNAGGRELAYTLLAWPFIVKENPENKQLPGWIFSLWAPGRRWHSFRNLAEELEENLRAVSAQKNTPKVFWEEVQPGQLFPCFEMVNHVAQTDRTDILDAFMHEAARIGGPELKALILCHILAGEIYQKTRTWAKHECAKIRRVFLPGMGHETSTFSFEVLYQSLPSALII